MSEKKMTFETLADSIQQMHGGMVQSGTEVAEPKLAIRDPYIFEFLGLKPDGAGTKH